MTTSIISESKYKGGLLSLCLGCSAFTVDGVSLQSGLCRQQTFPAGHLHVMVPEQLAQPKCACAAFTVDGVSLESGSSTASGGRRLAQVNEGPLQTAIVSATATMPSTSVQAFIGETVVAHRLCKHLNLA